MQIIIKQSNLKCSFFYKRNSGKTNHDNIDKELIEFAKRLSQSISLENLDIEIWDNVNLEDVSISIFQSRKSINLNFICFDKEIGGKSIQEKIIPLTLFFDLCCIGNLEKNIQNDQYIKLNSKDFGHLDSLILD